MKNNSHISGFTLVELMIALGIFLMVGIAIWTVLHTVIVLSSKNEAVNLTHLEGREVVNRISREIRSSVSPLQLVDASFNAVSSTNQASGVVFQTVFRGPNQIHNNCNSSSSNVRITRDPSAESDPLTGMQLIIPALQVQADIDKATGVNGQNGVQDIQLLNRFGSYTNPLNQDLTCNNGTPVYVTYVTQKSAFILISGELRYYAHYPSGQYSVIARNLTTTVPFSLKNGDTSTLVVSFVFRDSRVSSRNYSGLDLSVNSTIPCRYRMVAHQ